MRTFLLLLALGLPLLAQTSESTLRLDPILQVRPGQSDAAVRKALDGLADRLTVFTDAAEPLTHEGTGKLVEELKTLYEGKANTSNKKAKQIVGATGANKRAQAQPWKQAQAGKAAFYDKLGKALNFLDLFGKGVQGATYVWEGDYVGGGQLVLDEVTKKALAALGALGGSLGGPVGSVAGAAAGEELHKETTSKWIGALADWLRNKNAKDANLGLPLSGRFTGTVTWSQTVGDPSGMAPPMTFTFTGPMTADYDARTGGLKLAYNLTGRAPDMLRGATVGISMDMTLQASGHLEGKVVDGQFTASGTSTGTSRFKVDYMGAPGAPPSQEQTQRGQSAVTARGTVTREAITGTLVPTGPQTKPFTFTLTR